MYVFATNKGVSSQNLGIHGLPEDILKISKFYITQLLFVIDLYFSCIFMFWGVIKPNKLVIIRGIKIQDACQTRPLISVKKSSYFIIDYFETNSIAMDLTKPAIDMTQQTNLNSYTHFHNNLVC